MIRKSYLKPSSLPRRSAPKRSTKPIPRINPEATRKRRLRNQKRMRSPEYKAAKAGAMKRSDGRCEFMVDGIIIRDQYGNALWRSRLRCPETTRLQFHEEHYARGRILTSDDGKIYCFAHHRLAEKQKPHKQHRGGF